MPEEELFEPAPVFWGAEHSAVLPPLLSVHIQDHGPVPPTVDAVPALQRPDVGAKAAATPLAGPHEPSTLGGAATVLETLPAVEPAPLFTAPEFD